MRKHLAGRLAAGIAAVIFIGCTGCAGMGNSGKNGDKSLQKVLDAGKLVIGVDDSYPPMGFADDSGGIVGFDVDTAQEVCDLLGVTLETKSINWDTKEEALNSGEIDCIWNGMSVSDKRADTMEFSEPYLKNEMVFVVAGSSNVRSYSELAEKRIGYQSGSTAQDALEASGVFRNAVLKGYPNNVMMLEQLESGAIDAGIIDSVVIYYYILKNGSSFYILPGNLREESLAVGFRKGDLALRNKVQELLEEMNVNGKLAEISVKWFGSDITIVR